LDATGTSILQPEDRHRRFLRKLSKGKAIPLQALASPEGSRRLRLPDFKKIGI
jgi:hypothetical protein